VPHFAAVGWVMAMRGMKETTTPAVSNGAARDRYGAADEELFRRAPSVFSDRSGRLVLSFSAPEAAVVVDGPSEARPTPA
jgi:hypothetical protein